MPDLEQLTCRRSTRQRKEPDRYRPSANYIMTNFSSFFSMICLTSFTLLSLSSDKISLYATKVVQQTHLINQHFDGTLNYINPLAYYTENSENESYTFKQMLQQDDKNEFIQAMLKEIQDHETREHWHLFERNKIPKGHKTILAVWSFKRKRFPDGSINKYKARLCAHGGM